jgi:hypothetical protein
MAHTGKIDLPIDTLCGLIEEIQDPNSSLTSVMAHAHEIMAQNWNTGGQEILRLFPSVIGAPDGDNFLAIIKEVVTSLADMDVTEAHALLDEVYHTSPLLELALSNQCLLFLLMPLACIGIVISTFLKASGPLSLITVMLPTSVVCLLQSIALSNIFTSKLSQQSILQSRSCWNSQSIIRLPCIICISTSCILESLHPART